MTPDTRRRRAADARESMAARRRGAQQDRRLAGALARRAAGCRPMAAARAHVQADSARQRADHRAHCGDHPGAADLRAAADRLDRAAAILDPDTYGRP